MSRDSPCPVFHDRNTEDVIASLKGHSHMLPSKSFKRSVGVLLNVMAGSASKGIPNLFSS